MSENSTSEILNRRLASGEITIDEFNQLRATLGLISPSAEPRGDDGSAPGQPKVIAPVEIGATTPDLTDGTTTLPEATQPEKEAAKPSDFKKLWVIVGAVIVGGFVLANLNSGPSCEVSDISSRTEMLYINGLDYGVVVTAYVKNKGASGMVNIEALLSTSEGPFQRTRPYMLNTDQVSRVEFQFDEPSINVNPNDLQAVVRCASS